MLSPNRVKYRKQHRLRGSRKGTATRGTSIAFGSIALKAMTGSELDGRQIESARRTISRAIKRGGKLWIRIFPQKPITRKGAEVPMGSGKGAPDRFVAQVKPGHILFELGGIPDDVARKALKLAAYKLPVKCKIILKDDIN